MKSNRSFYEIQVTAIYSRAILVAVDIRVLLIEGYL